MQLLNGQTSLGRKLTNLTSNGTMFFRSDGLYDKVVQLQSGETPLQREDRLLDLILPSEKIIMNISHIEQYTCNVPTTHLMIGQHLSSHPVTRLQRKYVPMSVGISYPYIPAKNLHGSKHQS